MGALVGWLDPDEAAELRAELEAANERIMEVQRQYDELKVNSHAIIKATNDACNEEIAAKDAELEVCRSNLRDVLKKNDSLHEELAAKDAEITRLNNSFIDLAEWRAADIAARDLVIQKMREAIIELNHFVTRVTHWEEGVYDRHGALLEAKQALSIQPDTAALDEYVSQAVKQEREACAKDCENNGRDLAGLYYAGVIRARKP